MATPCFEAGKYFQDGKDILDFCEPKEAACGVFTEYPNFKINGNPLNIPSMPPTYPPYTYLKDYIQNGKALIMPKIGYMPTKNSKLLFELSGKRSEANTTVDLKLDTLNGEKRIKIEYYDSDLNKYITKYFKAQSFYKNCLPSCLLIILQGGGGGGASSANLYNGGGGGGGGGSVYVTVPIPSPPNILRFTIGAGKYPTPTTDTAGDVINGDTKLEVVKPNDETNLIAIAYGGSNGRVTDPEDKDKSGGKGGSGRLYSNYYSGYISNGGNGGWGSGSESYSGGEGQGYNNSIPVWGSTSYGFNINFNPSSAGSGGRSGGGGGASSMSSGGNGSSKSSTASNGELGSGGGGGGCQNSVWGSASSGGYGGNGYIKIYGGYNP